MRVDVVISLAGASIAAKRWSAKRKEILLQSRVNGNDLIRRKLEETGQRISLFIGGSGVGIYGDRADQILIESSSTGNGYLSNLCLAWEDSQQAFASVADRVATVRIGLVLAKEGGVLQTLRQSIWGGIGTVLGNGRQYMSWIHVHDLTRIFQYIIMHTQLHGPFNGVTPNPIRHRLFMRQLIEHLGGLRLLLPVPAVLLKLFLGEMSHVVLDSARVIPNRLEEAGFEHEFQHLGHALSDLLT